jgi:hypothetical protein
MQNIKWLVFLTLFVSCAEHDLGRITKVSNGGVQYNGTSAEVLADVIDLSNAKHESHGFCSSANINPTIEDDTVNLGELLVREPYEAVLKKIRLNQEYHFRPFVFEGDEPVYGEAQTVLISTIEGISVTNLSFMASSLTSADLTASIEGLGSLMCEDFGICYATQPQPTIDNLVIGFGHLFGDSTYTAVANGLDTYTLYHFRAYARLDSGTVIYGDEVTINISEPQMQTQAPTILTSVSCNLNGSVVSTGIYPVTAHGFCWGTSANPTTTSNVLNIGASAQTGSLQRYLNALSAGVSYHVRAYIESNGSTYYGDDVTFNIVNPTLVTGNVVTTSGTTATATGNLSVGNFPVVQRGHCWGTTSNPTVANTRTELGTTSQSGVLVSPITGLAVSQSYFLRAYARDSVNVFYGNSEVFSSNFYASITIGNVSNSNDSAVVAGGLTIIGNMTVTEYGHCWVAGTSLPTINDSRTNLGSSTSSITTYFSTMSGLQIGQQLRIRAYATDGQTVVYGEPINYTNNNMVSFNNHTLSVTSAGQLTLSSELVISGNVTVIQYGHCIAQMQNPTIQEPHTILGSTASNVTAISTFNNLPLALHYYRAYAVTPNGTIFSENLQVEFEGTWVQKASMPNGGRYRAIGFSAIGKGYVGLGKDNVNDANLSDLWEYNPSSNTWIQRSSSSISGQAAGISDGFFGYVLDRYGSTFLRYNPTVDSWTVLASFPGLVRENPAIAYFSGKIYIATGRGSQSINLQDFWAYDISSGVWQQLPDFPSSARNEAAGFSVSDGVVIGGGTTWNGVTGSYQNDYWHFSPSSNSWSQISNGYANVSFGIASMNCGYVGTGSYSSVFRRYEPESNTWISVQNVGGGGRMYSVGFSIGNKCYVGTGIPSPSGSPLSDFWEYSVQQ